MTTVSSSFTAAGISSSLVTGAQAENVTLSISGTYSAVVLVQVALDRLGTAWKTLEKFTTANATVSRQFSGRGKVYRLVCSAFTSGTVTYSFSDGDATVREFKDGDGNVLLRLKQSGVEVPGALSVAGALSNTGGSGAGTIAGASLVAAETGNGVVQKTVLTLTDREITVTDALAYAGSQLYDFPAGRILILGVTSSLAFAVTSDRATTINDDAAMDYALGSVTASSITLASTMVDLLPKQDYALTADAAAYNAALGAALAASAQFDGTTTPVNLFLNVAFPTNTEIDADGTLTVTGTVTIHWINLGDY